MDNIDLGGLIPVVGGIYGMLLVYEVIPVKPEKREKMDVWHKKYDKIVKILFPLTILLGIAELFWGF